MNHVVIVGGGIAGLAAAYRLETRGKGAVRYTLLESGPALGGKLASAHERGFVIEGGPDSFITQKQAALDLCREVGLEKQLMGTNDAKRQTFVWSGGRLIPIPEGVALMVPTKFGPFLKSPLISWAGKVRMGMEPFIPRRQEQGDESLAHFVRRRMGAEALDKLGEPMIAGIYVADAETLSLESTFPRFLDMEQSAGSLIRGTRAQQRAAAAQAASSSKAPMFMSLRGGMQELSDAVVARLEDGALWVNRRAMNVTRVGNAYRVRLEDGETIECDAVILATPAFVSADLVQELDATLAAQLRAIRYVSSATISLGYKRSEIAHPLNGFGFLVPRSAKRKIIAGTWVSTKFDDRAPADGVLLRAFVGGARDEARADEDDATLVQVVRAELREMMGITAEPVVRRVYHWHKGSPQYDVGHKARVAAIQARAAQQTQLYLIGSAYHGVGIPDCIVEGTNAANKVLEMNRMTAASPAGVREHV